MDASTRSKLHEILALRAGWHATQPHGRTVDLISREFLGTPYLANRLIGSQSTPEQLVIDFRGLDCFTYIDYVEALSTARSEGEFVQRLVRHSLRRRQHRLPAAQTLLHRLGAAAEKVAEDITARLSPHAVTLVKPSTAKRMAAATCPACPTYNAA